MWCIWFVLLDWFNFFSTDFVHYHGSTVSKYWFVTSKTSGNGKGAFMIKTILRAKFQIQGRFKRMHNLVVKVLCTVKFRDDFGWISATTFTVTSFAKTIPLIVPRLNFKINVKVSTQDVKHPEILSLEIRYSFY